MKFTFKGVEYEGTDYNDFVGKPSKEQLERMRKIKKIIDSSTVPVRFICGIFTVKKPSEKNDPL